MLNAQEKKQLEKKPVESISRSSHDAWLGVTIRDLTGDLKEEKNIKTAKGAYVNSVIKKSPADSVGLKEEDVIVSFNGKPIEDADALIHSMEKAKPGMKAEIGIIRDGEKKFYHVVLSSKRQNNERRTFAFRVPSPASPCISEFNVLGMKLSTLNKQLAEYFGAPDKKGVLVEAVKKESPAVQSGIKAGDVITNIQDERIQNVADVDQALNEAETGNTISINIIRKGEKKIFKLTIPDDFQGAHFPFPFGNTHRFPKLKGFHFEFPQPEGFENMKFDIGTELNHAMRGLHLRLEQFDKRRHWDSNEI